MKYFVISFLVLLVASPVFAIDEDVECYDKNISLCFKYEKCNGETMIESRDESIGKYEYEKHAVPGRIFAFSGMDKDCAKKLAEAVCREKSSTKMLNRYAESINTPFLYCSVPNGGAR